MRKVVRLQGLPNGLRFCRGHALNRRYSAAARPSAARVRITLLQDAEDLAAFRERAKEPAVAFEDPVRDLKRRGKL